MRRIFTIVAMLAASPACAGNFVYTSLDVPGASSTVALSINQAGEATGYYTPSGSTLQRGFVWANGVFTTFDSPVAGKNIAGTKIDRQGRVVFTAGGPHGVHGNVLLRQTDGSLARVKVPGPGYAFAAGFNNKGQIAGDYQVTLDPFVNEGFITSGNTTQTFAVPGAQLTTPVAMNEAGVVVGRYAASISAAAHGFIYSGGAFTSFDPPESSYTMPTWIGANGAVTGLYYTAKTSTDTFGFLYSGGKFRTYKPRGVNAYVTEVDYAVSSDDVTGNWYDLVQNHGFHFLNGAYYTIAPFNAIGSYIESVGPHSTMTGIYIDAQNIYHGFVATCPNAPCTN